MTLKVLNPPPHHLPNSLTKCLRTHQEEMLRAWESVIVWNPRIQDADGDGGAEHEGEAPPEGNR
jgi:hypothetical protein